LLLADEMGLGKTVQCIGAINEIGNYHDPQDSLSSSSCTILIVCPKSLLGVWQTELQSWLTVPFDIHVVASSAKDFPSSSSSSSSSSSLASSSAPSRGSITLINYDICHKFRERLHSTKYTVLICDEAHYLKSPTAKRTLAVLGDCTTITSTSSIQSEYMWLLTGTPVLNRPVELFPLLHAICPIDFHRFGSYTDRYCAPKMGFYKKMDFSGATNLLELSTRLKPFMLRRYKIDILTQLPPKFRSCVCLIGSDTAAELEQQRIRDVLSSTTSDGYEEWRSADSLTGDGRGLEEFGSEASDLQSYLEHSKTGAYGWKGSEYSNKLMGSLTTVRKETALTKLKPSIELLEDIILCEKVVVFAHHRELILKLTEHFGDRAVCIMGGMDTDSRSDAVHRFQQEEDVRVFIGSIRTAGLGLTLTAASRVVFLELDWSPGVMAQAEDRCHRVGQQDSVRIQYYVFKDTIDEWIAKSLLYKQSNIEQILPVTTGGVDTGYIFDFGKHTGLRLEDAPQEYVRYLLKNEVWRDRVTLWRALFRKGMIFEEPPSSTSDAEPNIKEVEEKKKENTELGRRKKNFPQSPKKAVGSQDVSADSTPKTVSSSPSTGNVHYVFDFGKYKGRKWSEVPANYREWMIREGVWKNRPNLKTALIQGGFHL